MKRNKGFTLIELIIVIIILGILAAFAIPKYMAIDQQARISVVNGLAGGIRSAAEMVHSVAVLSGNVSGPTNIGSANITLVSGTGYPDGQSTGINAAMSDTSGFTGTFSATNATYQKTGAPTATGCQVVYLPPAAAGNVPVVNVTTTGC